MSFFMNDTEAGHGLVTLVDGAALSKAGSAAALASETGGVLIFSRAGCPFCVEAKRTFSARGVPISEVPDASADVKAALKAETGQSTFPNVWIKGRFVGGCDAVKALEAKGELGPLVDDLAVTSRVTLGKDAARDAAFVPADRGEASLALLWFPSLTNRWIIQFTGLQIVAVALICIIFREERWAWWLTAFLLLDFVARFSFGAPASVLGSLALLATAPFEQTCLKPQWGPGPPKQFAAFCGICFTTTATCLYFTGHYTAGAVVLAALAGAASLEGFGNICVGCIFFKQGVELGLLPAHVYRIATTTREEQRETWEWKHLASHAPPPEPTTKGGYQHAITSDEYKKDDMDVVRHVQVSYFAAPTGLAGLAIACKIASDWAPEWATAAFEATGKTVDKSAFPQDLNFLQDGWWQAFSIVAAVAYGMLLLLYLTRCVRYPQKIVKEWHCPTRSNGFVLLFAPLVEFAFLVYDVDGGDQVRFARALWWMGSVPIAALTALKIGEWIGRSLTVEHVTPAWVLTPAANLIAALVGPVIPVIPSHPRGANGHTPFNGELFGASSSAVEISSFFYASGAFFALLLFAITFAAAVATPNLTVEPLRNSAYAWLTIPTLIGLCRLVLDLARAPDPGPVVAFFAQTYYVSLMLFAGLTAAWIPHSRQFFGQDKWNMSYWGATFPLDALAAAAAMYYQLSGFHVALVLEVACFVVAVGANVLCVLHTVGGILRRRGVFTPEPFFGPAAFMKLTHEAFRGGLPKLQRALAEVDPTKPETVRVFCARYAEFRAAHDEHAKHEDEVLFKCFGELYPEVAVEPSADHEADEELFDDLDGLVATLAATPAAPAAAAVAAKLDPWFPKFLAHLREEEHHVSPVARKYIPLALQKQLVRQCFELTPAAQWERLLPYVVENCPRHPQRIKYVQALCWAMPERAQQIGAILYRHVDAVMWERLRASLPDIVPRGCAGYRKHY